MDEYVKREDVIKEIEEMIGDIAFTSPYQDEISSLTDGMQRAIDCVEKVESADVAPVVRGHWERVYEEGTGWVDRCCRCKSISKDVGKFCSNCGASMKTGE